MKKFSILVLVVFIFAGAANAQLRFGIKGGANFSSLSTPSSEIDQVKAATNYQAGVLMQVKLGAFAIQPEILYSMKGSDLQNATESAKLKKILVDDYSSLKYETQTIDVPINLQLGKDFGPARVYLQAGPYFSFLVGAALDGDVATYDKVDKELKFNNFDWGIGMGLGAELGSLQLSVKYDFGMTPVGDKTITSSQYNINMNPFYEMKNRNLNVSLAYLF